MSVVAVQNLQSKHAHMEAYQSGQSGAESWKLYGNETWASVSYLMSIDFKRLQAGESIPVSWFSLPKCPQESHLCHEKVENSTQVNHVSVKGPKHMSHHLSLLTLHVNKKL